MANGIEEWWNSLPIVTKYLFALSFGLTLAGNFHLINPVYIILDYSKVFNGFEIWRLVTCFFFHGKLGFGFLIHMLFLVRYGQSLEQTTFAGRTADFIFCILVGAILFLVIAFFLKLAILGKCLIMMLIYIWSRKNPDLNMTFMFGVRFQSFYFPWVLVAFDVLMGGFPLPEVIGILVGHIYYFLEDIYPVTGGTRILKTPQFLYNWFPPANGPQAGQPRAQRYGWGRGQPLGQN